MGALVVITTVGTEEQAVEIAEELIGRRHAACVNIVQVPRTIYRWKGKVCRDSELMLVIKTTVSGFDRVEATIKELHDYELPEVLGFEVSKISAEFLPWIESSLARG
jgi:periplasmic divalent cation tolerance protein